MTLEAKGAQQPERDISGISLFTEAQANKREADDIFNRIEERLEHYQELEPEEVYRLTIEQTEYYQYYDSAKDHPEDLAASLRNTLREGAERITKAKGYSEEKHGGMRSDLFKGFLTELKLYQQYKAQKFQVERQAERRPLRRLQRFFTGR